jgi:hypothetical protein
MKALKIFVSLLAWVAISDAAFAQLPPPMPPPVPVRPASPTVRPLPPVPPLGARNYGNGSAYYDQSYEHYTYTCWDPYNQRYYTQTGGCPYSQR